MKRRIACLLICVCLLLCMALPAGAQDEGAAFTDRGRIRNVGAVQMLVDLGLISGYSDGSFRPASYITREEVAKLIAILCTENPQAPADVYFYDAQNSWALSYIGYCAGQGIIAGDGMGSFRPKDNVTAQELAKMLLVALGYNTKYEGIGGATWQTTTDVLANLAGERRRAVVRHLLWPYRAGEQACHARQCVSADLQRHALPGDCRPRSRRTGALCARRSDEPPVVSRGPV